MVSLYTLYQHPVWITLGLLILVIWSLIWKGMALWFSAKHRQKAWFIVLLIFNTAGILPILYLLFWRPKKTDNHKEDQTSHS